MAKTIFEKKILSPNTMIDFIYIQERSLSGTSIGNMNSTPTFSTKWLGMGKIEVVNPTFRFEGVAIPEGTTHIIYMPFVNTVFKLDGNKCFCKRNAKIPGLDSRYYKCMGKTNYGEQDEYLLIYAKETSFADIEAGKV